MNSAGRFSVLIATPTAVATLASDSSVARVTVRCLGEGHPVSLSPAPFVDVDSAVIGRPMVVISILPSLDSPALCEQAPQLLARGIQAIQRSLVESPNDVRGVIVRRGGVVLDPSLSSHASIATILGSSGATNRRDASMIRIAMPIEDFAPDAGGHLPRVTLTMWGRDSTDRPELSLADSVIRSLWRAYLPSRIERLRESSVRAARPLTLPPPRASVLRPSWRRYTSGDLLDAARMALTSMNSPGLSSDDAFDGNVLVASVLLAYGDTIAARIPIADALSAGPCLTLRSSDDALVYARALDLQRTPARCTFVSPMATFGRSLIPGFGHFATSRGLVGSTALLGTTALSGAALFYYQRSTDSYSSYRAATTPLVAQQRFADASSERVAARNLAIGAAGAWGLSIIDAVSGELRHEHRVERVIEYGAPSRGRVSFGIFGPASVAVGMRF